ncbi:MULTISPECIES: hypothetical protein [unclassified Kitasatospora]|uniref:hypothetical protein n=1 Tax=unclassified Kitasatospora TaxID=2633591 RepID=UPI00070AB525|nr:MULTISPECIES: hypothetical protein [unclassified Kitasatospora]KQV19791.1 hypothetical protein ASC99_22610 [Kitasatospora sp. Root107]KRB61308.1 hypothetical protein ASE03_09485 [Kitasatospora sp. Root187]
MTQTARTARPATAPIPDQHIPVQRTPLPSPAPAAVTTPRPGAARRFLEILRGARSLRPVTAGAQQSYGECDGQ